MWTATRGRGSGPCGQSVKNLTFCGRHKWMAPKAPQKFTKLQIHTHNSIRQESMELSHLSRMQPGNNFVSIFSLLGFSIDTLSYSFTFLVSNNRNAFISGTDPATSSSRSAVLNLLRLKDHLQMLSLRCGSPLKC